MHLSRYLRSLLVAMVALALSAGLAFGARQQTSAVGTLSGGVVVLAEDDESAGEESGDVSEEGDSEGDEEGVEDEGDEEGVEDEEDEEGGDSCTDPTLVTPEELAELRHGSVVCWAAQQTEWPEWFSNHGQFVRCWAQSKKADAPSCTEDPNAEEPTTEEPTTEEPTGEEPAADATRGHGKGHGKAKGKNKHQE